MNTTEYTGINSLSIKERKNISRAIFVKLYLFLFFIVIPLMFLQEFFALPYIINTGNANSSMRQTLLTYFQTHYITHTYFLLIIINCIAIFVFTDLIINIS